MLTAAYSLFKDKGFEHTTYQDIADAVGTTRTIVQSYFPKKTRITEEIYDKIMQAASNSVLESDINSESPNITLSRICQVFLGYLLHDDPMRRFTKTTLALRDGTAKNIVSVVEEIMDFCGTYFDNKEALALGYTMALGGTYEIIYRNLCSGAESDVAELADFAIRTFIVTAGTNDLKKASEVEAIKPATLEKCYKFMDRNMFRTEGCS